MADLKISQLTAATTPLAGTEVFPIVQSSATVKATIADVQAAPIAAQTADRMLFLNGSKVPSTSANATFDGTNLGLGASPTFFGGRLAVGGHIAISAGNSLKLWNAGGTALNTVDSTGVNFTANTPAAGMTSQLLNWYEEGTWTPTINGTAPVGTATYASQVGRYTRIGRCVYFELAIDWSAGTGGGSLRVGLPITSSSALSYPGVSIGIIDGVAMTAGNYPTAFVRPNSVEISFRQSPTGGGSSVDIPYDAAGFISLSGCYSV